MDSRPPYINIQDTDILFFAYSQGDCIYEYNFSCHLYNDDLQVKNVSIKFKSVFLASYQISLPCSQDLLI